jgi:hypothetical protein
MGSARPGVLGQFAAALVLFGFALFWSLGQLRAPDPLIWASRLQIVLAIVAMLGAVGVWIWVNLKLLARFARTFAITSAILGILVAPFAFLPVMMRLDVVADRSPPAHLVARVDDYLSTGHAYYKGMKFETHPRGVVVTPLDPAGPSFNVDRFVIRNASGEYPPTGARLSLLVHPGTLGIPWVSDASWTTPPPAPARKPTISDEDLAALRAQGRDMQRMLDKLGSQQPP